MTLRSLLLAGTVLPFAFAYPAAAVERSASAPILLAQSDEACPEGQEDCQPQRRERRERRNRDQNQGGEQQEQPAEQAAPAAEPPPPPPPAEEQPAEPPPAPEPPPPAAEPPPPPPAAEPPPEQPATQQSAPQEPSQERTRDRARQRQRDLQQQGEQPPAAPQQEQQAAPEPPPPQQQEAAPPQAAPQQPAAGQSQQERTRDRARRRQQELQQGQQPPAEQPQQQQAETPPPPATDNTVEQQLEAQGDREEARKVRNLREQLLDQLQQAVGGQPPAEETRRDHNRERSRQSPGDNRDRRDGDRGDRRDADRGDRRDRDIFDRGRHDDRDVVERRGGRIIIDLGGGNLYVEPEIPEEGGRLLYGADDVEVQNLRGGRTRTIVHRPDGVDIVTERDRYGNIVKRSRMLPGGREIVLIDNRYDDDEDFRSRPPILRDVPPPRVTIPRERYIVDLGRASEDDIRGALLAPPVQAPPRAYTLDEVLYNQEVRAYSPRIDLDTITFEFGSSTIGNDQMRALYSLGQAMEAVIAEHPDEVYLIEGHTDAVGSDYDNLILSDQRAEAVATALSQNFDIPPENLVTEGYGEQYLKVNTEAAERQNRRATVRRLTELLQASQ